MSNQSPIASTPSAEIAKAAAKETVVTDARNRKIGIKKPGILAQFRLVELLEDTSSNATYMNMVLPIIFVVSIDGDEVPFPNSKREVEALIQRLDEDGLAAVAEELRRMAVEMSPEKEKTALKK